MRSRHVEYWPHKCRGKISQRHTGGCTQLVMTVKTLLMKKHALTIITHVKFLVIQIFNIHKALSFHPKLCSKSKSIQPPAVWPCGFSLSFKDNKKNEGLYIMNFFFSGEEKKMMQIIQYPLYHRITSVMKMNDRELQYLMVANLSNAIHLGNPTFL